MQFPASDSACFHQFHLALAEKHWCSTQGILWLHDYMEDVWLTLFHSGFSWDNSTFSNGRLPVDGRAIGSRWKAWEKSLLRYEGTMKGAPPPRLKCTTYTHTHIYIYVGIDIYIYIHKHCILFANSTCRSYHKTSAQIILLRSMADRESDGETSEDLDSPGRHSAGSQHESATELEALELQHVIPKIAGSIAQMEVANPEVLRVTPAFSAFQNLAVALRVGCHGTFTTKVGRARGFPRFGAILGMGVNGKRSWHCWPSTMDRLQCSLPLS